MFAKKNEDVAEAKKEETVVKEVPEHEEVEGVDADDFGGLETKDE